MNVDRSGGVSSADLGLATGLHQQQGQIRPNQQPRANSTTAKKPRIASFNQNRPNGGGNGILSQQQQQYPVAKPPKSTVRGSLSTQGAVQRPNLGGPGAVPGLQRAPAPSQHQSGPFPNMLSPMEAASLNASLIGADGLEREQVEGSPTSLAPPGRPRAIGETPRGGSDWSPPTGRHPKQEFGGMPGGDKMLREQDRFLPIANIARIMKRHIPDSGKIAKESKECIQECVSEFVSFITSEASERCLNEKRKTINGEDILWAMQTLGFEPYVDPLKMYLTKYRAACKGDKALEEMGLVPMIGIDSENHQEHICITASGHTPADLSALFQGGGAQGAQFLLATSADLDPSQQGGNNSNNQGHMTNVNHNQLTFLTQSQNSAHSQQQTQQQLQQMPIVYLDGSGFHGNQAQGTPGRPQFITLNQAPQGVQFLQLVPASSIQQANSNAGHHVITLQPASSAS